MPPETALLTSRASVGFVALTGQRGVHKSRFGLRDPGEVDPRPPVSLMRRFQELAHDTARQARFLKGQNDRLLAARDLLLRLMGGESEV